MKVITILSLSALHAVVVSGCSTSLLRGNPSEQDSTDGGEENRKLKWRFVPLGITLDDDSWYNDADEKYVGTNGDGEDWLRGTDVCYSHGTFSRSNCPSPPNCDFGGSNGPAKLCIMRMPRYDGGGFHVLAMKCIPRYGDCERCLCGTTDGNGICHPIGFDDVDDSRVNFRCTDLRRVTIKGHTWVANSNGGLFTGGNDDGNDDGGGYKGYDDTYLKI